MKIFKTLIVITLIFLYLFFSYTRFYRFIGTVNLKSPFITTNLALNSPSGTELIKYVALGDSLSAGVGSTSVTDTFVYLFALNLSKKYKTVELVDLAQPGGMSQDVINNQLTEAIKQKPNYVTVLIGTNDIHNRVSLIDFSNNYNFILSELVKNTDAKIIVINIPYLGSAKTVYPPFNFLLDLRVKQFNQEILKAVSRQNNSRRIQFIDLYTYSYLPSKQNSDFYSRDEFHPSDAGYKLWGEIINAN